MRLAELAGNYGRGGLRFIFGFVRGLERYVTVSGLWRRVFGVAGRRRGFVCDIVEEE